LYSVIINVINPCRSRYRERIHVLKSLLTEEQKEEYTRALSATLNSLPPEAAAGQLSEAGDENKVRRTLVFRIRIEILS
jgi:hypothetical protein